METPETALTVVARAAIALGSDKARTELAELVKKSANIVEVKNQAGREEAHSAAMALVRARTNIEKIGKAARDDATKFSKAVIAVEKELIGITQPEEDRLLGLRNAWDDARAAEKAEAERLERARITSIHERIAEIRGFADSALQSKSSLVVASLIAVLMDYPMKGFDEFDEEAANVRGLTLARMAEIRDTKAEEEAERARVAAEQEAERQRLAAERDELARQQAEAKAQQDKIDAERRAQAEADAAELARQRKALAEENARINAELEKQRAEHAAAAARLAEERAELERLKNPPVVVVEPAPEPVVLTLVEKPQRPTDVQIVEAIAGHFSVPAPVALSWLIDLDVMATIEAFEGVAA